CARDSFGSGSDYW
nr:immunoglobulin heavy chain junction region [Macaca mulatta]MOW45465.1 immunoglobulin heavy chain junction region [Macaca mulatta]MOW45564.1 immunoglobulin heavy chain junction region [Macaca mulatta]MOW45652.1 immunoglobulin heavy chain junction region [Macaca mulatta]MOW45750.1 immunoglobulin heavy chain junction region [Macaca mulatta]